MAGLELLNPDGTPATTESLRVIKAMYFDEPVGEQLGVDTKISVVAQQPEYLVRDGADAGLQRGAVGYALRYVPGDLAVGLS